MKLKIASALILAAIGTSAYATCQYTPQGCTAAPSTSSSTSSATGGNSSSNAAGGNGGSVRNSGNSTNTNSQDQGQSQYQKQKQTANGGTASSNAIGGQGGLGGSGTGVGSQGQSVNVEAQKRAAASAFAAPLTSSNDTCMGSSTGALQMPGVGVSIGSTWTDKNCMMLKNSREMWNMGLKEAALARMCMDADNKEAIELSGVQCPARKKDTSSGSSGPSMTNSASSSGNGYTGNDPIVQRRLGLRTN